VTRRRVADPRPRAALALAAALLALPWLRPAPAAPSCAEPAERAARDGHTIEVACGGGSPVRGPARLLFGLPLDPNTADPASLEALPEIGPARARAIVAARCARRFESPRELERVAGIGARSRARLEPWLAVDPSAEPACGVE
jgi:competence protein ComEA